MMNGLARSTTSVEGDHKNIMVELEEARTSATKEDEVVDVLISTETRHGRIEEE